MNFLNRYCVSFFIFILFNIKVAIKAGPIFKNNQNCKDPSGIELEKKWLEARKWWNANVLKKSNEEIEKNFAHMILDYNHTSKSTFTSKFSISKSKCEMENQVRYRENRFPKLVVESKCKSKQAIDDYKCSEVETFKLALERGECENNIYKWDYRIERIPSNCICIKDKVSILNKTN
jgi:hypothetical protein